MTSYRATYMRGGTSRALIFHEKDLPADRKSWDALFLRALGSPDHYGRQLDGMGGGISSLSKVAIVRPSTHPHADIDYTFAQVSVTESKVDYKGNCGNISSAIGPYAVLQRLCSVKGEEACIRIFNTNTQKIIHSHFPVKNGMPEFAGKFEIPGVSGTGAPIRLEFQEPGGASTGKLLPTGKVCETLTVEGVGSIEVSMVDAANACVFIRARDVGMTGKEMPIELETAKDLLIKLDLIRRHASVAMGIAKDLEDAKNYIAIPYIGIVSDSPGSAMDFEMRVIASGQPHKALPLTVSLCSSVTAKLPGSIIHEAVQGKKLSEVRIGMPSGILTLDAQVENKNGHWIAHSGSFYRTARPLFVGDVFT
ncbi:PrpF family protein [Bdellovibrio sp. SKB1291214]|uniref:2-methylaconitate cis-trans isomerase PrpF family protein n=1 Tax=Bdellovibrio sp. SKB1291214 TaxID=1732569 RepID=UPI000B51E547|nr:PrpF domain-containing protein [Bdellovibrio sp. SKB1291214]UYL07345.1 PrpF family protein [Bdellovibrio sp. SKB1291214]